MEVRTCIPIIDACIALTSRICSSEGIQIGNVRSKYGVLGSWTTVLHDRQDPVGEYTNK